jgi:hypothetical protein
MCDLVNGHSECNTPIIVIVNVLHAGDIGVLEKPTCHFIMASVVIGQCDWLLTHEVLRQGLDLMQEEVIVRTILARHHDNWVMRCSLSEILL